MSFELPYNASKFLSNIIDAYPKSDFLTLRKVIGLGKVIYGEEDTIAGMPLTAAIMNTKPYTLIFGRKFMQKQMQSIYDCVYILSHELTHLVLDHFAPDILKSFEEKETGRYAMHIVTDCQVNATCYHSLQEEKYFEFIKRFYSKTEMPDCFFRYDGLPTNQIDGWKPITDEKGDTVIDEEGNIKMEKIIVPLEVELQKHLRTLHEKLYSVDGITNEELIEGLKPWLDEQKNKQEMLQDLLKKIIGNHPDILKDRSGNSNSNELDELTDAIIIDVSDSLNKKSSKENIDNNKKQNKSTDETENQERELDNGTMAGSGTTVRERLIKTCKSKLEYIKNIKKQLKKSEVVSPSSRIFSAISSYLPKRQVRSVIPNFYDRRTASIYSITGKPPIFNNCKIIGSNVVIPCYLDVSGSQDHVLPYVLPVVSRLKDKIGYLVYCFSNYISETKICNLERGKIKTSGGTDFNPIALHILKNNFKYALILTDGQAYLNQDLIQKLRRRGVKITVGWTVSHPSLEPLNQIAQKTFFVFDKNKY